MPNHSPEKAQHRDGCPEARPWLYSLNERPLECICADLAADDIEEGEI